jgi:hypothetical protein
MESKYFSRSELDCRCGCGFQPTEEWTALLNEIREAYGQPIFISKGGVARCQDHNRNIGGARFSQHKRGAAADLVRTPGLLDFLLQNADRFNIWIEDPEETPAHIHIDRKYRTSGRVFKP